MASSEIDSYLAGLAEPQRRALQQVRESIRAVVPDAEECISYGLPAFKVHARTVAGFGAFKNHLSYLPHSGSVLTALSAELTSFEKTKSSLHFPVDRPLHPDLVRKLVEVRVAELDSR
jgi:uncharacterized protein YdhG (YjbR/CyaY superfamily)